VTNNRNGETKGTANLEVSKDWLWTPPIQSFDLKQKGDKAALKFDVGVPNGTKPDSYKILALVMIDRKIYDQQERVIAYPHIQTHRIYTTANVITQVIDLKVAPVRVGYIMGTGDKVPQAIKRLGLDVTMLDANYLATGDLSKFDTIVVGIRASQVRPDYV